MFDTEKEYIQVPDQTYSDTADNVEQIVEVASSSNEESRQEKNFRALRESKERAERERDDAVRLIREMELQKQRQEIPVEEEDEMAADEIIEGRHLSKVKKEIKQLRNEVKHYQQRAQEDLTEAKIKARFPDFEKIVTPENVALLKSQEPELADSINATSDIYTKAISAYNLIKRLGISAPDNSAYEIERQHAQRNAAKPRPLTSIAPQQGESPLSRANAFANGLTDELKKQLQKEMEEIRRTS
jgi:hypothetical protein